MTTAEPVGTVPPVETVDLRADDLIRDPFAAFAELRERAPLARATIPGVDPFWIAVRYQDVRTVLSDPRFVNNVDTVDTQDFADLPDTPAPAPAHRTEQVWRARGMPPECAQYLRAGVFDADGARHRRMRGLVHPAFTAGAVERLRPRLERLAEEYARALPEHADPDGVVDLVAHFAYPLPVTVICELLGIPETDRPQWRRWSSYLGRGAGPGLDEALHAMVAAARELIERRRAEPAEGLLSQLAAADGDTLDPVETVSLILNLVVAGHETTATLIGNGTAALLTHPEQLALVRADPGLLPAAVDELMRWCGPTIGGVPRYATEDLTLAGTLIRKGEAVMPILAGANHDPRVYAEPERLDVCRASAPDRAGHRDAHLGFGHGAHRCLGAVLAHEEAVVAFGALLRTYPQLALAVGPEAVERGPNPAAWHLAAVPVRLGPQAPAAG
ncbi:MULTISPECIES: cytochrome P450 family protein [Streptomyces]|uniref:cytochrome P450 family protein n=1 Tax=Streptomyces TaxID=1883 RepID=UPI000690CD8F|nr:MULTISPECIES: cytochrome P450 [Streptomyces]